MLVTAVKEVRLAVISSTVASLVVFLPLIFTSNLSSAILGDLAKTVVFSHGLSAVVALILVPTVRLHLMSREGARYEHPKPFAEKWIRALENGYARALSAFLDRALLRAGVYACVIAMLAGAATLVLPRLPKEIIGKPDTDWVTLGMWTRGNTFIRQMESHAEETEARFLEKFGDDIDYTFTQVYAANGAWMMARLKDKRRMREVKAAVSEEFQNTPFVEFWVDVWNPAELPIPDPPQLQIAARGGTPESRKHALEYIDDRLRREFPDNWVSINPGIGRTDIIQLSPLPETLGRLARERGMSLYKLADLLRVATEGRSIGYIPVEGRSTAVVLRFPKANGTEIRSAEEVAALPIAIDSKIVPLKAIAAVDLVAAPTNIRRESGKEVSQLTSRSSEEKRVETAVILGKAEEIIADWKAAQKASGTGSPDLTLQIEDAEKDLTDAIRQLSIATALSIALIFLTLLLQFGSFVNAALILVAIPLGFLGVLLSLYAFGSTLSLNSILGVILLNGIAVANSILLVDFTQRLVEQGMAPRAAAIAAARQRLRPILITSLTTILGMMPIALGFGEGGRILQPLGIAVSGGLWLSMTLTLFIVPALHVYALDFGLRPRREPGTSAALAPLGADPVT